MRVRFFPLFFLLAILKLEGQTPVERQLNRMLEQPHYRNASVGIHVVESSSGKPLLAVNAEKLFIPASVMKIVTSAAALDMLGEGYRFYTRVGYSGHIKNGVLKGDLVIVGGGDPALGSEYFAGHYFAPHFLERWTQQLKATGIKRVEGNLVLDVSLYDTEKIPPTWIWEDIGNYYGAGTSALTVYDNLLRVTLRSPATAGKPTEITSVHPEMKELTFKNEVLSSEIDSDLAYVFGDPFNGDRIIRGTIPKNREAFMIKASNPFPEILLAEDFIKTLARGGVFVSGKIVEKEVPETGYTPFYVEESPPLSEIIKVLNYESINLFAEHMVKQIAVDKTGTGNYHLGLALISEYWKNKGLDHWQLIMEDGSGLSRFNSVSPTFVTSLLSYMKKSGSFPELLPGAGEGTLAGFDTNIFKGMSLRAKSGSMTRVRCYAGYLLTKSGNDLAFSIMINHYSGSNQQVVAEIKTLLTQIYNTF